MSVAQSVLEDVKTFKCGHPRTAANTYARKSGRMIGYERCRTCTLEGARDYQRRKRAGEPLRPNHNAAKTACPNGHPYNSANTYVNPNSGHRLCRRCQNSYQSGYMQGYLLKTRYRLTHADRVRMLIEQDGLCAICYEEPATQVDHDHQTGEVRGLLCGTCNKGLGLFHDDVAALEGAVLYMKGE